MTPEVELHGLKLMKTMSTICGGFGAHLDNPTQRWNSQSSVEVILVGGS